jgi:type 1 glutamine amidotransferase
MLHRWAPFTLGVLASLAATAADAQAAAKVRVLIIDGQNNHNWKATTPWLKRELEASDRFSVQVASHMKGTAESPTATVKFPPDLGEYDVVVSNYNGDPWPKELQDDLAQRLRDGKIGLVIVHAANNSFGGWREYNEMIGLGWRGPDFGDRVILGPDGKEVRLPKGKGPGSGHGAQHPFLVTIRDSDHPVTRGMPHEWLHNQDELYHGLRGPAVNMHLLATAYSDRSKGGTGEHEPMMWTITYGKGRVFHTPMGHDLPAIRCVGFMATLLRGTEWAATGEVTIPLPEKFPTDKSPSVLPEGK